MNWLVTVEAMLQDGTEHKDRFIAQEQDLTELLMRLARNYFEDCVLSIKIKNYDA